MNALPRQGLRAAAPLGVLAFWCGMLVAGRRYPAEYDWRYMTISDLVYVVRNPDGYAWAWGGLLLCALGGLCWTALLLWDRDRRREGAVLRPAGIWALGLGYLCMISCPLLPEWLLRIPKGHEILALSAFVGQCIGIVLLSFQAAERRLRLRARGFLGGPRLYAGMLASAALCPILLEAIAQTYVSHFLPELPWVGLEWRARGVSMFLCFAFWEWITCAVFSVYTVILSFATTMV